MVAPWRQTEITLTGARDHANPYTDIDVWAEFTHDSGTVLRRPAFWDGGRVWKGPVRLPGGGRPLDLAQRQFRPRRRTVRTGRNTRRTPRRR